jgi:hypothetical protein
MSAKRLSVVLSIVTASIWGLYSLVAPKFALFPLLGLLPIKLWTKTNEGMGYLLLFPVAAYLSLPLLAWFLSSRKIAWLIPIAPLVGGGLFAAQFLGGMSAFH